MNNMTKSLGKYKGNDVELCMTTNERVSHEATQALIEEQIPFTRNHKHIPFYKRVDYQGADGIWVIKVNPRRYSQARRAIDRLDLTCRSRLVLSNY